jgi:hypothetical protein
MISLGAERVPKIGIGVYVEPPLHDRLEKTAKECGTSISVFCRPRLWLTWLTWRKNRIWRGTGDEFQ